MTTIREMLARLARRGLAAALVLLLFAFCLSSVALAFAADGGCGMSGSSARICAQAGAADSALAALPQIPFVQPRLTLTAWLASPSAVPVIVEFHADPSTPRAPPLSLF